MTKVEQARTEGEVQGSRDLLTEILRTRFGKLPRPARERINDASLDQLKAWARRVPSATSLEDALLPEPEERLSGNELRAWYWDEGYEILRDSDYNERYTKAFATGYMNKRLDGRTSSHAIACAAAYADGYSARDVEMVMGSSVRTAPSTTDQNDSGTH